MADADPNAKTDATKRKEFIEKKAKQEAEAQAHAERAGGTGMISQAPQDPNRKVDALDPQRFQQADFRRNQYVAIASEGTRPEDLNQPGYWAHLGEKLRPWDEVMVRADDGLWYARAIVMESGRNFARVHVEHIEFLTTADVAITQADAMSPYEVKYRGGHAQWSVIRKSDQSVVHEGAQTKESAFNWLKGRLQAER